MNRLPIFGLPIFRLPGPPGRAPQHINFARAVTSAAIKARRGRQVNDRRA